MNPFAAVKPSSLHVSLPEEAQPAAASLLGAGPQPAPRHSRQAVSSQSPAVAAASQLRPQAAAASRQNISKWPGELPG